MGKNYIPEWVQEFVEEDRRKEQLEKKAEETVSEGGSSFEKFVKYLKEVQYFDRLENAVVDLAVLAFGKMTPEQFKRRIEENIKKDEGRYGQDIYKKVAGENKFNWEKIGISEEEYTKRYGTVDILQLAADKLGISVEETYQKIERSNSEIDERESIGNKLGMPEE